MANVMQELTIVVKTAGTAVRFVEGGPLAEALAELDVSAARTALIKAENAVDKRSQVWSAVNHLEGAVAAIESKNQGARGKAHFTVRASNWMRLQIKRAYILALMAICYRYLGEEELAHQCVARGREGLDLFGPAGTNIPHALVASILAVPNILDTTRWELDEDRFRVDWQQFELPPRGLTSPG